MPETNGNGHGRRRMHIDPAISAGSIMSTMTILLAAGAIIYDAGGKLSRIDVEITTVEQRIERLESARGTRAVQRREERDRIGRDRERLSIIEVQLDNVAEQLDRIEKGLNGTHR